MVDISQYLSILVDIGRYRSILVNICWCLSILVDICRYWPTSTNMDQYWPMLTNIDQNRPMSTNIDQYQPISTNIDQSISVHLVNIRQYWSIGWHLSIIDQYWSLTAGGPFRLRSTNSNQISTNIDWCGRDIDQYWSILTRNQLTLRDQLDIARYWLIWTRYGLIWTRYWLILTRSTNIGWYWLLSTNIGQIATNIDYRLSTNIDTWRETSLAGINMHQHKGKIPSIYDDFDDMLICRLAASQVLPMFVSVSVADGGTYVWPPVVIWEGP